MDWQALKLEARLDGGHWHFGSPRPGVVVGLQWAGEPCGWLMSCECRSGVAEDCVREGALALGELFDPGWEWFSGAVHVDPQTQWVTGPVREMMQDEHGQRNPRSDWANDILATWERLGATAG